MDIFSDAIWVIIFICGFVVFLGVCALIDYVYRVKIKNYREKGK